MQHPISTFDVGWQPEILSPIARLPAGLYSFNGCTTVYCRLKICAHFRGLVLEYFLTKNCLELSIFEVNEQEKTTEDKNLDLQIHFAIDHTRCALCECETCRRRTHESIPFTAHAAVP